MDDWKSWPKIDVPTSRRRANDKRYKGQRLEGTETIDLRCGDDGGPSGECWWCTRPGTRLCDTPLVERIESEYEINGRRYKRFLKWESRGTCDASICDECTRSSPVHFNTGDPQSNFWDSFDQCPWCQLSNGDPETRTKPDEHRECAQRHARLAKFRPRPA